MTSDEAVRAVEAIHGRPDGGGLCATVVADTALWSVGAVDDFDRPSAGGGWLVAPDGRVFELASNPGIHDWPLAARLLTELYDQGLGDAVGLPPLRTGWKD